MTAWTVITDAELSSGKPIKASQGRHLRDNVSALAEGAAGAPSINRAAISPGSSGVDGAWVDATVVTGLGYWEALSIEVTAALTLPGVSVVRVDGNVSIAAGATLDISTVSKANRSLVSALGINVGAVGFEGDLGAGANKEGGGGGSVGAGGVAGNALWIGGVELPVANARWFWMAMRGIVGGYSIGGGGGGPLLEAGGGGCLILIINGNLTMGAGAKIRANGANGAFSVPFGGIGSSGGGGGGSVIVVCAGTIADGTFEAKGGTGDDGSHSPGGGGGGGGYVALVAAAYTGTQTGTVTGGTTAGGGTRTSGAAGLYEKITLTNHQINSLLLRST